MHIPRLVIAGTHSGSGKTTVSTALMALFSAKGFSVLPYKVGPDYIDPAFHTFITGKPSRNLDSWLLSPDTLTELFRRPAQGEKRELAVIEGVMGLYDGSGSTWEGSTAQVASILKAPVILVIDGKGMAASAAALASGYARFLPGRNLAGVICNRVSGPKHYNILQSAILERTGIPCLGWLPANPAFAMPSRRLGLAPPAEVPDMRKRLEALAGMAKESLDLDGLEEIARAAPELEAHSKTGQAQMCATDRTEEFSGPVIGIAKDAAFSFYYQDNLDLLESLGATLVPFSPLEDAVLPEGLHGLYLGGGFPEMFAEKLADNHSFRESIRSALEAGMPAYAECGGMLYLCSTLTPLSSRETGPEKAYPMAGFFPQHAFMTGSLRNFGYVRATILENCVLGPAGISFRAHEFHYSRVEISEFETVAEENGPTGMTSYPVLHMQKTDGRAWYGGMRKKRVLAGFPHLHFHACQGVAAHFLKACGTFAQGGSL